MADDPLRKAAPASAVVARKAQLAAQINALLPQTQCTRCGYPDCAAYAQAIANKEADINRCPPGGQEGIARLAQLTGRPALPLDAAHGQEGPRSVAVIDEAWCIGCTLCLPACPTDAILGSNKRMHSVIEVHCTGCELCIPVCPVDCISLVNVSGEGTGWQAWSAAQAQTAAERYAAHQQRMDGEQASAQTATSGQALLEAQALPDQAPGAVHAGNAATSMASRESAASPAGPASPAAPLEPPTKSAVIQAALARARAKANR